MNDKVTTTICFVENHIDLEWKSFAARLLFVEWNMMSGPNFGRGYLHERQTNFEEGYPFRQRTAVDVGFTNIGTTVRVYRYRVCWCFLTVRLQSFGWPSLGCTNAYNHRWPREVILWYFHVRSSKIVPTAPNWTENQRENDAPDTARVSSPKSLTMSRHLWICRCDAHEAGARQRHLR